MHDPLTEKWQRRVATSDSRNLPARFDGGDDVNQPGSTIPQAEERCSGAVRDDAALATGQGRGKQSSVLPDLSVANHESAPKDRMQPTRRNGVIDRRLAQSEVSQLVARDNPVLSFGQPGNPLPLPTPAVPLRRYIGQRNS